MARVEQYQKAYIEHDPTIFGVGSKEAAVIPITQKQAQWMVEMIAPEKKKEVAPSRRQEEYNIVKTASGIEMLRKKSREYKDRIIFINRPSNTDIEFVLFSMIPKGIYSQNPAGSKFMTAILSGIVVGIIAGLAKK